MAPAPAPATWPDNFMDLSDDDEPKVSPVFLSVAAAGGGGSNGSGGSERAAATILSGETHVATTHNLPRHERTQMKRTR